MSVLTFIVSGEPRECPAELWERLIGPKPADDWKDCNGCSASPDSWRGLILWPGCRIHDWHYSSDGPDIPRILADLILRINLWRCLRAQGAPWWRAGFVAAGYHAGVTIGGRRAYKPGR